MSYYYGFSIYYVYISSIITFPGIQQVTAFLGEDFDLDVYGLDELGRFTAVVLKLSDASVS